MNIQEAKTEIARTYRAYMKRNEDGSYRIPVEKQRPVLLIGPPGIGKTAVMKQIAEEEGCGLVSYSMTHHTRQSAIGLPYISHKEYGGRSYAVTEYTMSEIVASIYDYMDETGKRSGILFLDEINCVSETLAPVMLQLLQNKRFGNMPIPENWLIVAAGNPPEYNKSVREMDMATLDRVKNIDVEADLEVWQKYALANDIHPAVRSYLCIYPDHFYRISEKGGVQLFVTARGWEDLSLMLSSYEDDGIVPDEKWFLQYLQDDEIARSFGLYYDLFREFGGRIRKEYDAEGRDLADMLLANPGKLEDMSSSECISAASMLCHPLIVRASDYGQKRSEAEKRKELISRMPPDGSFADDESVAAYLRQKRMENERKREQITADPAEYICESRVLDLMEKDMNEWRKLPKDLRPPVTVFEKEKADAEERALEEMIRKLEDDIDAGYRVLKACPQGRSALLYYIHDLSALPGLPDTVSANKPGSK
ncbi:MAG: AAA family ATPase [Firmicutes bacterium]|nr:AAA family ATPase [Bacillota bacterium]